MSDSREDTVGSACSCRGRPQSCRTSPQRRADWPVPCTAGGKERAAAVSGMLGVFAQKPGTSETINHLASVLSKQKPQIDTSLDSTW